MYGLSKDMIANNLEWAWRSLLLYEIFVIPTTHKHSMYLNYQKVHIACNLSFIVKSE